MSLDEIDADVAALVTRLARLRKTSVNDVLRAAVEREWQRETRNKDERERLEAFHARLREMSQPDKRLPVDKAFIDSLYEDD